MVSGLVSTISIRAWSRFRLVSIVSILHSVILAALCSVVRYNPSGTADGRSPSAKSSASTICLMFLLTVTDPSPTTSVSDFDMSSIIITPDHLTAPAPVHAVTNLSSLATLAPCATAFHRLGSSLFTTHLGGAGGSARNRPCQPPAPSTLSSADH